LKFKLLSYNIWFGGRGRERLLAETIRGVAPDLVVFQEATDPRVIAGLAEATGMPHWAAKPAHSIGFISKVDISHYEWHYPRGSKHSFMEIAPVGMDVRIFGLHLSAQFSKWVEQRRVKEIQALLEGIKHHQDGFHVLCGDFNTLAPGELLEVKRMPAWIRALVWLSGRDIQRTTIQWMLNARYIDGFRTLHPEVRGSTFPTWDPHLRLDYVFLPAGHAQRLVGCEVIQDRFRSTEASDHYPLLAELQLDPGQQ
jgi:endonuclease/exonuclease/phosphatase family metal-dependent hydrolase